MALIRDYHRPPSIDAAIALLARDGTNSVIIGGGTLVNADGGVEPIEVVDLQALGLSGISAAEASRLRIGATTRLEEIATSADVPELVREAAHREAPNTIRNAATAAGTVVAADPESGLVAALLVHAARLEAVGPQGAFEMPLADFLADRSRLAGFVVTAVTIETGGLTAWAGTGRTPADTPIVAAYARRNGAATYLALCGIAATPIIVPLGDVASLEPPGDFRGSPEYRRSLAQTLSGRVLSRVGETP